MENNLKNLPPFYSGQKVMYVGVVLPKNSIWTVRGFLQYSCGCWGVDIGLPKQHGKLFTYCDDHQSFLDCTDNKGVSDWVSSLILRPIQESPFPSLTFKEVIEKEKVLTCNN